MPRGRPRKNPLPVQTKATAPLGKCMCNRCGEIVVQNFPDYIVKMMPNQLICNDCATNIRKTVD